MMSGQGQGQEVPVFKLKAPREYFTDEKTLALLSAALAGDEARAQQLVAQGANPNDEGPKDNPYNRIRLLHYAIVAKNQQAVRVLAAVGADLELNAQGFGNAFLFAQTLYDLDMLSLLLDLRPVDKLPNDTLYYLMFDSITETRPRVLELMLKRGVPIDFRDSAGYTVLIRAMDAQDYDLAEWLLKQGASVNIETKSGMTPAYSTEFHLNKFKPGSPTYNKVLRIKQMMAERGAVFPAQTPEQVRQRRGQK